jgi:sulfide:quinone oxidoreductase
VDPVNNVLKSFDEREIPYDVLITIPTNKGSDLIARSGMGDNLNLVPTDKFTLQAKDWPNIWVMGDATNIPASKAGAVVHFQLEYVVENMWRTWLAGKCMPNLTATQAVTSNPDSIKLS